MGRSAFAKEAGRPLLLQDGSSTAFGGLGGGGGGGATKKTVVLYDMQVLMEMKSSLCQGYTTLLTGACAEQSADAPGLDEAKTKALTLAFASLTSGNVIDACFGLTLSSKGDHAFTQTMIKEAKNALDAAATTNELVEKVAVDSYKNAFKAVIAMNHKLEKLNFFTQCFFEKTIRNTAMEQIQHDFFQLEHAIAALH
jgi:hypothetical protein